MTPSPRSSCEWCRRGTLGQMVMEIGQLPRLSKQNAMIMEEAAQWGREPEAQRDPWTS